MLTLIKSLHTLVWVVMTVATVLIFRGVLTNNYDIIFYAGMGLIILEVLVLFLNRGVCPLTPLAAKYTEDRSPNFDIYLPSVVAQYNKQIFGVIFLIILLIRILNVLF